MGDGCDKNDNPGGNSRSYGYLFLNPVSPGGEIKEFVLLGLKSHGGDSWQHTVSRGHPRRSWGEGGWYVGRKRERKATGGKKGERGARGDHRLSVLLVCFITYLLFGVGAC